MIHVVIAARSPTVRRELRALIESDGIRVVGEDTGIGVLNGHSSDRPRPDVLVAADPEWLPERVDAGTAIVAVGDDPTLVGRLARMGAVGWAVVPRDGLAELLRAAVIAAAQGMAMMPAAGAGTTAPGADEALDDDSGTDEDSGTVDEPLTSREREVLELIASGLTNRAIAERLGISEHTVKFHISTIYGKLGASTRTAAVRRAVHRGLLTL